MEGKKKSPHAGYVCTAGAPEADSKLAGDVKPATPHMFKLAAVRTSRERLHDPLPKLAGEK